MLFDVIIIVEIFSFGISTERGLNFCLLKRKEMSNKEIVIKLISYNEGFNRGTWKFDDSQSYYSNASVGDIPTSLSKIIAKCQNYRVKFIHFCSMKLKKLSKSVSQKSNTKWHI